MKWIEADPIPEECESCTEADCCACDIAGKRWVLSKEDELRSTRALMVRAVERLQRRIAAIDAELEKLRNK